MISAGSMAPSRWRAELTVSSLTIVVLIVSNDTFVASAHEYKRQYPSPRAWRSRRLLPTMNSSTDILGSTICIIVPSASSRYVHTRVTLQPSGALAVGEPTVTRVFLCRRVVSGGAELVSLLMEQLGPATGSISTGGVGSFCVDFALGGLSTVFL